MTKLSQETAPTLLRFPEPCYAWPPLDEARQAIESGDKKRAGEKLLESLAEFLRARCEFGRCMPRIRRNRTIVGMLNSLNRIGYGEESTYQWTLDILEFAHKAIAGETIKSSLLTVSVEYLESCFIESDGISWPVLPERMTRHAGQKGGAK